MKIKTHIYMANLLLDEIKKYGSVILPGVGNYKLSADVKDAILSYPDAFRAGAAGPDFYPDMFFGQTVIHSESSGEWIDRLFREYGRLPDNYPEKKKCYSFVLGFMMHYAGDMYGHNNVNNWARGWWEYSLEVNKLKIITRHFLIESYMDRKVPQDLVITMDAPMEFIQDCFLSASLESEYSKAMVKMPIDVFVDLEAAINSCRNNNEIGTMDLANYFPGWVEDIRKASREWLVAWQNVAYNFSDQNGSVIKAKDILEDWINKYFLLMVGVPEWAKTIMDKIGNIIDALNILKPLKDQLKQMIFDYLSKIIFILTNQQVKNLDEALEIMKKMVTDPIFYLNNGMLYPEYDVARSLHNEMGNYGKSGDTLKQSYQAFYQCLNMCKLCLIGPDNLNQIVSKYSDNFVTIRIKTASNSLSQFGCGTDNDVYFAVIAKNGKVYEKLLDNFLRNDFESGQIDTFIFNLPLNLPLSEISKIRLRKDFKNFSDDWKPEWIELYDPADNRIFFATINRFIKNREDVTLDVIIQPPQNSAGIVRAPSIRLKANYGQYVCAEGGGGREVVANRPSASIWETFTVHDTNGGSLMSGDSISLMSNKGKFVCAEGGGGHEVVANRDKEAEWERFIIENAAKSGPIQHGDKITLRCYNRMYVCAENGGGRELVANRPSAGAWETFTIEFVDQYESAAQYQIQQFPRGVRHLKIEIHTKDSFASGTDDNVYLAVFLNDGSVFETLLDQPGRNDFETNQTDSFVFDLPQTILLNKITQFRLRKDYDVFNSDWDPDWIKLYDEGGNLIYNQAITKEVQGRSPITLPASLMVPMNTVSIDPKIISFLYSLDGRGHDSRNPTPELPWDPFPFYTNPSLRTSVYQKLFVNCCTKNLTSVHFKAHHGKYLCAENGGGREIVANRPTASIWETFIVKDMNEGLLISGDIISLGSFYGNYLYAENGGGQRVMADRTNSAEWEKFVIQKTQGIGEIKNGDLVTLKGINGMYVSAAGQGANVVHVNSSSPGDWETFTIEIVKTEIPIPPMDEGSQYSNLTSWTGFEYDPEQGIFCAKYHPWQETFGYFPLYDLASPLAGIYIHCEPICFITNDNRSWKIELWKGQYGICTGAEIGVYVGALQINTPYHNFNDRINTFLNHEKNTACADSNDWLQMSYVLKKNGQTVFTRNSDNPNTPGIEKHWWLTGFKPAMFSLASELTMEITITLITDDMCTSFKNELTRMGYTNNDIISGDNRTVRFVFSNPKAPQPW